MHTNFEKQSTLQNKRKILLRKDPLLITGGIFAGLSGLLFLIPLRSAQNPEGVDSIASSFGYVLTFLYYLLLITYHNGNKKAYKHTFGLSYGIQFLTLFHISCYNLNRSIGVFPESTEWLSVFLVIENTLLIVYSLLDIRLKGFKILFFYLMGFALVLHFYQAVLLIPLYIPGAIATVGLGIGLHAFVPVTLVLLLLKLCAKTGERYVERSFLSGALLYFLLQGFVVLGLSQSVEKLLDKKLAYEHPFSSNDLPLWVSLSADPEFGFLDNLAIRYPYDYAKFGNHSIFPFGYTRPGIVHDPFVAIAGQIIDTDVLSEGEQSRIYTQLKSQDHNQERRLWSGTNLTTNTVTANVEIDAKHRLSFTELLLTIRNSSTWKRNQQEALYSFYLPEGAVVSSLSLWIDGKEEPARFTSKKKAEKAYTTIVGRERRDPAVVYWRENNRVLLRVFPCTPKADRKVKIGFTAPLTKKNDQLVYSPIRIKGPSTKNARLSVNLVQKNGRLLSSPWHLKDHSDYSTWKGNYTEDWSLEFALPAIPTSQFSFKGSTYELQALYTAEQSLKEKDFYLDLNQDWTTAELDKITSALQGYNWYFLDEYQKLQPGKNYSSATKSPRFSLFPFYRLKNAEHAIILSKTATSSPGFSDLKNSPYFDKSLDFFEEIKSPIQVWSLSENTATVLEELSSLNRVSILSFSVPEVVDQLKKNRGFGLNLSPNQVRILQSNLSIVQTEKRLDAPKAPDHLLRLFQYHKIIDSTGLLSYSGREPENVDRLIDEAYQANIVTPFSSLIVLETEKDYDRFGIKKQDSNSLSNAKIRKSGEVPEPEEWILIITSVLALAWSILKRKGLI